MLKLQKPEAISRSRRSPVPHIDPEAEDAHTARLAVADVLSQGAREKVRVQTPTGMILTLIVWNTRGPEFDACLAEGWDIFEATNAAHWTTRRAAKAKAKLRAAALALADSAKGCSR